ncbi:MAG: family 16 glycoside hydrolase, partial [Planctomycetota bacterium]
MTRPSTSLLAALSFLLLGSSTAPQESGTFRAALESAERLVEAERWGDAELASVRALERDRRNTEAWAVRARAAAGAGDVDLQIYCLHQELRNLVAQGAKKRDLEAKRAALTALDPTFVELDSLRTDFSERFAKVAKDYEGADRPHGAIRVWKEVLALDPENAEAIAAIERIASRPDPSLAGDAKPKDLFEDVTAEWIAEYDAEHAEWNDAGEVERDNYFTVSNAGYEVLIRTAEAMEQMSAFYKQFFRYGTPEDGRSVSRITVHVFGSRDEYLEYGIGPPVEWSAGHFTGSHVECYIGGGGFEGMVGVLFHEAAHQYVGIATNAVGWLNEGLASFFEGTRILPNGAVIMNEPADHRLFPLATRMDKGWMADHLDGYDPADSSSTPEKAPTWSIILEGKFTWGPPWYAPTWGFVFFCYNFQDPLDGRFIYRDVFMDFVDKSGGKVGSTAINTFEEVVLANPKPAYEIPEDMELERGDADDFELPQNVVELDDIWKEWTLRLRDERSGKLELTRPYARWARLAAANGDPLIAKEHFEKGLANDPDDFDLALDFAQHLAGALDEADRASRIVMDGLRLLEAEAEPDLKRIARAERLLSELDPKRRSLTRTRDELAAAARGIVAKYAEAERPAMVQDVAWRFGSELGLTDLFGVYEDAVVSRGGDMAVWDLAYNERSLEGWATGSTVYRADGIRLVAENGEFDPRDFDYQMLTLDRVTSGDFSLEARMQAEEGRTTYAGFVFGAKSTDTFHGAIYFPPRRGAEGTATSGFFDVMSSYGGGVVKAWRHVPVAVEETDDAPRTTAGEWHTLRLDVVGSRVDVWWDGSLLTSHDFQLRDVVLGGFGLLTGKGEAKFRDVRYLARDPRDPAGRVERRLRLERAGTSPDRPVDGSFLGLVPPFPKVERWVQEPRASFAEVGPHPQLLVLWSIRQNNIVPIDGWLRSFAQRWESVGLEVVSIVSPNDSEAIEAYLAEHPVPGSLAVDSRPKGTTGIGEAFTQYAIRRFNLPRILLLDVDGTVAWEGDPGFSSQSPPEAPFPSYVDTPMEDLVDRRQLVAVAAWRKEWESRGAAALAAGDVASALDIMRRAREFGEQPFRDVREAQARLDALEAAIADADETIAIIEEAEAGPALDVLIEWAELLGSPFDRKRAASIKKAAKGRASSHWKRAQREVEKAGKGRVTEDELLAVLDELEGPLVKSLASAVRTLGVEGAAGSAGSIPAAWLARNVRTSDASDFTRGPSSSSRTARSSSA